MKILITNDDGIGADGIAMLEQAAKPFGEIITVAPNSALSGCGHQISLDCNLQLVEVGENRFQLNGMPADCVRIAVARFGPFDWVLSGINQGANLGVDLFISGTVAAAREASQLSIPAIAFSQYRMNLTSQASWESSRLHTSHVLPKLFGRILDPGQFWNVNFPDVPDLEQPEVIDCDVDTMALPMEYKSNGNAYRFAGDYHSRPRKKGTDVDCCFSGNITVSRV